MSSALEKLFFTITLMDHVSGPSKSVCQSFQTMQQQGKDAFLLMGKGFVGLTANAASLLNLTNDARDFSKALGEVASLGVSKDELDKLAKESRKFAMRFGEDATAVARSAYDIQSAIPGLAKGALAAFTVQGSLLAKATKADAATITKFQGTMYNIFEKSANKIGQAKWVEMLTGKTAHAVKIFKTTGNDMSAAFTNLGSTGEKAGVSLEEQLAVLGTLQGTMGGANAGTAYKAFLNSVGRAQLTTKDGKALKFTDDSGKLLPMVEILEKIRAAVGPGQLKLADQTKLMQTFGDEGGKAVLNLLDKTESLKGSIGDLSKIQDSGTAVEMAEKMVDPYERFTAVLKVLRITFGQGLLPVVNTVLDVFSGIMKVVVWCLDYIPFLRTAVSALAVIFSAAAAALSVFYLYIGAKKYLTAFGGELRIVYAWCLKNAAATHSMTAAQRANAIVQMLWRKSIGQTVIGQKLSVFWTMISAGAVQFWTFASSRATAAEKLRVMWSWICTRAEIAKNLAMNAGVSAMLLSSMMIAKLAIGQKLAAVSSWIMTGGLSAAASAAWAFTAALLANPVTWIVAGIVALIGALAALVYWWDDVCGFCVKYADYLLAMLGPIGWIVAAFRNWDKIKDFLVGLWKTFQKVCPNIAGLIEKLAAVIWAGIRAPFVWISEKVRQLSELFARLGGIIAEPFRLCWEWLSGKLVPVVQFFSGLLEKIGGFFTGILSGISNFGSAVAGKVTGIFSGLDGWIGKVLRTVSKIPGFGFLDPDVSADGSVKPAGAADRIGKAAGGDLPAVPGVRSAGTEPVIPDVVAVRQTDVPAGGIRNSQTTTRNYGGISIFAPNGISPAQLDDWLLLNGV